MKILQTCRHKKTTLCLPKGGFYQLFLCVFNWQYLNKWSASQKWLHGQRFRWNYR